MFQMFPSPVFAPESGSGSAPSAPSASPAPSSGGGEASSGTPAPSSPSGASPSPTTPSTPPTQPSASPGAGSAASSPAPAPGPSSIPPSTFEFDGLQESDDFEDLGGVPAQPNAAPAEVQPVPSTPPQAPPAQAAPPTEKPPVAPQASGQQEAAPQTPSPAEPARIADLLEQNQPALVEHLAQTEFKLSEAEIEALDTDVMQAVPRIMAKLYVKSQQNFLKQLQTIVPAMLQSHNKVTASNSKNETTFFQRWPALNREQHGELVHRLAITYRQMNPKASLEQMVEELGPIAMMTAKLPLGAAAPNGNGHAAPPQRPMSPPSPFKPAMSGGGGIPAASSPGPNDWILGLAGDQSESD